MPLINFYVLISKFLQNTQMKILFDWFALFISVMYYQYRCSHQRCFIKKLFLKISKYSQESTCVGVYIKKALDTVFVSREYCKIFKSTILKNIYESLLLPILPLHQTKICDWFSFNIFAKYIPANNCMFKVNNRNSRTRCEICSKLTIKTLERHRWRRHWRCSGVFIANFEHFSHLRIRFFW